MAAEYLGDFGVNQAINIYWSSYNSLGAPVTLSSQGTVWVCKNNSSTSTQVGITDTKDLFATGSHLMRISQVSNTFFSAGNDYVVIRSGDTIDGQFFGGAVACFSVRNRDDSVGTYGELTAAPVADGPTKREMLQWTYQMSRTTITQTATQAVLKSSNNSSIATSTTTDDGTTAVRGRWI